MKSGFITNMSRSYLLIIIFFLSTAVSRANELNGIIRGKVTTSDGNPASEVTVSLKEPKRAYFTQADGSFVIRNLAEGTYELEITMVGHEPVTRVVSVPDQGTTTVLIELRLTASELEQVVITSGRRKFTRPSSDFVAKMPLNNLENAQVYTTVSKELINEQMHFTVDDATKNAPGLQKMWEATGRGGDGGAYYNSRGFVLQSQLRNGVAGNVTSKIDAANIERIEVVKGPSATLFGNTLTSYGGLINRVTKKPHSKFGGEITYANGSYGFNRLALDINTPLNEDKNVLLRVNAALNSEGSFQDNGFDKGYVIAPSLSYNVNEKLSFLFDAEFYGSSNSSKQMIFFYFPAEQLGASRPEELGIDYKRSYSANDIFQRSRSSNLFGQMNYKISDTWTSQTNFTSSQSFSDGPYAYFYLVPNALVTGDPAATGSDYLVRADQSTANSQMYVTEVQQNFIGDFQIGSFRNRLVAGLDFFSQHSNQMFYGANFDTIAKNGDIPAYSRFNRDNLNAVLQNPNNVWTWPSEFKTNTYSAYVSDVFNITDYLIVSAALRIDHFDNKGNFNEASGQYGGGYKQTVLSPKFGIVFQPIVNTISLFANYQNGFTNKTGTDYELKTFRPEQANQIEGGVKLDAFEGKLSSTLSYYSIRVKDIVRPYSADPLFSIQDGSQISKGFEAEVIGNPVRGLNVIAGFSYNDSKLEKADEDVNGRRPSTAMSPYSANLWVSYRLSEGKLKGLGLGAGGNYASDNKILNSVYYGEFTLPAYTVLNASLFYDHDKFRAGVKMDNLTNKQYWIGYTTMNPQKLRSVVASISLKF